MDPSKTETVRSGGRGRGRRATTNQQKTSPAPGPSVSQSSGVKPANSLRDEVLHSEGQLIDTFVKAIEFFADEPQIPTLAAVNGGEGQNTFRNAVSGSATTGENTYRNPVCDAATSSLRSDNLHPEDQLVDQSKVSGESQAEVNPIPHEKDELVNTPLEPPSEFVEDPRFNFCREEPEEEPHYHVLGAHHYVNPSSVVSLWLETSELGNTRPFQLMVQQLDKLVTDLKVLTQTTRVIVTSITTGSEVLTKQDEFIATYRYLLADGYEISLSAVAVSQAGTVFNVDAVAHFSVPDNVSEESLQRHQSIGGPEMTFQVTFGQVKDRSSMDAINTACLSFNGFKLDIQDLAIAVDGERFHSAKFTFTKELEIDLRTHHKDVEAIQILDSVINRLSPTEQDEQFQELLTACVDRMEQLCNKLRFGAYGVGCELCGKHARIHAYSFHRCVFTCWSCHMPSDESFLFTDVLKSAPVELIAYLSGYRLQGVAPAYNPIVVERKPQVSQLGVARSTVPEQPQEGESAISSVPTQDTSGAVGGIVEGEWSSEGSRPENDLNYLEEGYQALSTMTQKFAQTYSHNISSAFAHGVEKIGANCGRCEHCQNIDALFIHEGGEIACVNHGIQGEKIPFIESVADATVKIMREGGHGLIDIFKYPMQEVIARECGSGDKCAYFYQLAKLNNDRFHQAMFEIIKREKHHIIYTDDETLFWGPNHLMLDNNGQLIKAVGGRKNHHHFCSGCNRLVLGLVHQRGGVRKCLYCVYPDQSDMIPAWYDNPTPTAGFTVAPQVEGVIATFLPKQASMLCFDQRGKHKVQVKQTKDGETVELKSSELGIAHKSYACNYEGDWTRELHWADKVVARYNAEDNFSHGDRRVSPDEEMAHPHVCALCVREGRNGIYVHEHYSNDSSHPMVCEGHATRVKIAVLQPLGDGLNVEAGWLPNQDRKGGKIGIQHGQIKFRELSETKTFDISRRKRYIASVLLDGVQGKKQLQGLAEDLDKIFPLSTLKNYIDVKNIRVGDVVVIDKLNSVLYAMITKQKGTEDVPPKVYKANLRRMVTAIGADICLFEKNKLFEDEYAVEVISNLVGCMRDKQSFVNSVAEISVILNAMGIKWRVYDTMKPGSPLETAVKDWNRAHSNATPPLLSLSAEDAKTMTSEKLSVTRQILPENKDVEAVPIKTVSSSKQRKSMVDPEIDYSQNSQSSGPGYFERKFQHFAGRFGFGNQSGEVEPEVEDESGAPSVSTEPVSEEVPNANSTKLEEETNSNSSGDERLQDHRILAGNISSTNTEDVKQEDENEKKAEQASTSGNPTSSVQPTTSQPGKHVSDAYRQLSEATDKAARECDGEVDEDVLVAPRSPIPDFFSDETSQVLSRVTKEVTLKKKKARNSPQTTLPVTVKEVTPVPPAQHVRVNAPQETVTVPATAQRTPTAVIPPVQAPIVAPTPNTPVVWPALPSAQPVESREVAVRPTRDELEGSDDQDGPDFETSTGLSDTQYEVLTKEFNGTPDEDEWSVFEKPRAKLMYWYYLVILSLGVLSEADKAHYKAANGKLNKPLNDKHYFFLRTTFPFRPVNSLISSMLCRSGLFQLFLSFCLLVTTVCASFLAGDTVNVLTIRQQQEILLNIFTHSEPYCDNYTYYSLLIVMVLVRIFFEPNTPTAILFAFIYQQVSGCYVWEYLAVLFFMGFGVLLSDFVIQTLLIAVQLTHEVYLRGAGRAFTVHWEEKLTGNLSVPLAALGLTSLIALKLFYEVTHSVERLRNAILNPQSYAPLFPILGTFFNWFFSTNYGSLPLIAMVILGRVVVVTCVRDSMRALVWKYLPRCFYVRALRSNKCPTCHADPSDHEKCSEGVYSTYENLWLSRNVPVAYLPSHLSACLENDYAFQQTNAEGVDEYYKIRDHRNFDDVRQQIYPLKVRLVNVNNTTHATTAILKASDAYIPDRNRHPDAFMNAANTIGSIDDNRTSHKVTGPGAIAILCNAKTQMPAQARHADDRSLGPRKSVKVRGSIPLKTWFYIGAAIFFILMPGVSSAGIPNADTPDQIPVYHNQRDMTNNYLATTHTSENVTELWLDWLFNPRGELFMPTSTHPDYFILTAERKFASLFDNKDAYSEYLWGQAYKRSKVGDIVVYSLVRPQGVPAITELFLDKVNFDNSPEGAQERLEKSRKKAEKEKERKDVEEAFLKRKRQQHQETIDRKKKERKQAEEERINAYARDHRARADAHSWSDQREEGPEKQQRNQREREWTEQERFERDREANQESNDEREDERKRKQDDQDREDERKRKSDFERKKRDDERKRKAEREEQRNREEEERRQKRDEEYRQRQRDNRSDENKQQDEQKSKHREDERKWKEERENQNKQDEQKRQQREDDRKRQERQDERKRNDDQRREDERKRHEDQRREDEKSEERKRQERDRAEDERQKSSHDDKKEREREQNNDKDDDWFNRHHQQQRERYRRRQNDYSEYEKRGEKDDRQQNKGNEDQSRKDEKSSEYYYHNSKWDTIADTLFKFIHPTDDSPADESKEVLMEAEHPGFESLDYVKPDYHVNISSYGFAKTADKFNGAAFISFERVMCARNVCPAHAKKNFLIHGIWINKRLAYRDDGSTQVTFTKEFTRDRDVEVCRRLSSKWGENLPVLASDEANLVGICAENYQMRALYHESSKHSELDVVRYTVELVDVVCSKMSKKAITHRHGVKCFLANHARVDDNAIEVIRAMCVLYTAGSFDTFADLASYAGVVVTNENTQKHLEGKLVYQSETMAPFSGAANFKLKCRKLQYGRGCFYFLPDAHIIFGQEKRLTMCRGYVDHTETDFFYNMRKKIFDSTTVRMTGSMILGVKLVEQAYRAVSDALTVSSMDLDYLYSSSALIGLEKLAVDYPQHRDTLQLTTRLCLDLNHCSVSVRTYLTLNKHKDVYKTLNRTYHVEGGMLQKLSQIISSNYMSRDVHLLRAMSKIEGNLRQRLHSGCYKQVVPGLFSGALNCPAAPYVCMNPVTCYLVEYLHPKTGIEAMMDQRVPYSKEFSAVYMEVFVELPASYLTTLLYTANYTAYDAMWVLMNIVPSYKCQSFMTQIGWEHEDIERSCELFSIKEFGDRLYCDAQVRDLFENKLADCYDEFSDKDSHFWCGQLAMQVGMSDNCVEYEGAVKAMARKIASFFGKDVPIEDPVNVTGTKYDHDDVRHNKTDNSTGPLPKSTTNTTNDHDQYTKANNDLLHTILMSGISYRYDVTSKVRSSIADGREFSVILDVAGANVEDYRKAIAYDVAEKPPHSWPTDSFTRFTEVMSKLRNAGIVGKYILAFDTYINNNLYASYFTNAIINTNDYKAIVENVHNKEYTKQQICNDLNRYGLNVLQDKKLYTFDGCSYSEMVNFREKVNIPGGEELAAARREVYEAYWNSVGFSPAGESKEFFDGVYYGSIKIWHTIPYGTNVESNTTGKITYSVEDTMDRFIVLYGFMLNVHDMVTGYILEYVVGSKKYSHTITEHNLASGPNSPRFFVKDGKLYVHRQGADWKIPGVGMTIPFMYKQEETSHYFYYMNPLSLDAYDWVVLVIMTASVYYLVKFFGGVMFVTTNSERVNLNMLFLASLAPNLSREIITFAWMATSLSYTTAFYVMYLLYALSFLSIAWICCLALSSDRSKSMMVISILVVTMVARGIVVQTTCTFDAVINCMVLATVLAWVIKISSFSFFSGPVYSGGKVSYTEIEGRVSKLLSTGKKLDVVIKELTDEIVRDDGMKVWDGKGSYESVWRQRQFDMFCLLTYRSIHSNIVDGKVRACATYDYTPPSPMNVLAFRSIATESLQAMTVENCTLFRDEAKKGPHKFQDGTDMEKLKENVKLIEKSIQTPYSMTLVKLGSYIARFFVKNVFDTASIATEALVDIGTGRSRANVGEAAIDDMKRCRVTTRAGSKVVYNEIVAIKHLPHYATRISGDGPDKKKCSLVEGSLCGLDGYKIVALIPAHLYLKGDRMVCTNEMFRGIGEEAIDVERTLVNNDKLSVIPTAIYATSIKDHVPSNKRKDSTCKYSEMLIATLPDCESVKNLGKNVRKFIPAPGDVVNHHKDVQVLNVMTHGDAFPYNVHYNSGLVGSHTKSGDCGITYSIRDKNHTEERYVALGMHCYTFSFPYDSCIPGVRPAMNMCVGTVASIVQPFDISSYVPGLGIFADVDTCFDSMFKDLKDSGQEKLFRIDPKEEKQIDAQLTQATANKTNDDVYLMSFKSVSNLLARLRGTSDHETGSKKKLLLYIMHDCGFLTRKISSPSSVLLQIVDASIRHALLMIPAREFLEKHGRRVESGYTDDFYATEKTFSQTLSKIEATTTMMNSLNDANPSDRFVAQICYHTPDYEEARLSVKGFLITYLLSSHITNIFVVMVSMIFLYRIDYNSMNLLRNQNYGLIQTVLLIVITTFGAIVSGSHPGGNHIVTKTAKTNAFITIFSIVVIVIDYFVNVRTEIYTSTTLVGIAVICAVVRMVGWQDGRFYGFVLAVILATGALVYHNPVFSAAEIYQASTYYVWHPSIDITLNMATYQFLVFAFSGFTKPTAAHVVFFFTLNTATTSLTYMFSICVFIFAYMSIDLVLLYTWGFGLTVYNPLQYDHVKVRIFHFFEALICFLALLYMQGVWFENIVYIVLQVVLTILAVWSTRLDVSSLVHRNIAMESGALDPPNGDDKQKPVPTVSNTVTNDYRHLLRQLARIATALLITIDVNYDSPAEVAKLTHDELVATIRALVNKIKARLGFAQDSNPTYKATLKAIGGVLGGADASQSTEYAAQLHSAFEADISDSDKVAEAIRDYDVVSHLDDAGSLVSKVIEDVSRTMDNASIDEVQKKLVVAKDYIERQTRKRDELLVKIGDIEKNRPKGTAGSTEVNKKLAELKKQCADLKKNISSETIASAADASKLKSLAIERKRTAEEKRLLDKKHERQMTYIVALSRHLNNCFTQIEKDEMMKQYYSKLKDAYDNNGFNKEEGEKEGFDMLVLGKVGRAIATECFSTESAALTMPCGEKVGDCKIKDCIPAKQEPKEMCVHVFFNAIEHATSGALCACFDKDSYTPCSAHARLHKEIPNSIYGLRRFLYTKYICRSTPPCTSKNPDASRTAKKVESSDLPHFRFNNSNCEHDETKESNVTTDSTPDVSFDDKPPKRPVRRTRGIPVSSLPDDNSCKMLYTHCESVKGSGDDMGIVKTKRLNKVAKGFKYEHLDLTAFGNKTKLDYLFIAEQRNAKAVVRVQNAKPSEEFLKTNNCVVWVAEKGVYVVVTSEALKVLSKKRQLVLETVKKCRFMPGKLNTFFEEQFNVKCEAATAFENFEESKTRPIFTIAFMYDDDFTVKEVVESYDTDTESSSSDSEYDVERRVTFQESATEISATSGTDTSTRDVKPIVVKSTVPKGLGLLMSVVRQPRN